MIEASADATDSTNASPLSGDIGFNELITKENIYRAWKKFSRGKLNQAKVVEFWLNLECNLNELYHDLATGKYEHGHYRHFVLRDVKKRDIYVAEVRDRVVHQLIAEYLELIYSKRFYRYSCSSQKGKGTSLARTYALKVIRGLQYNQPVWLLKLDIKKYFQNIDHEILFELLKRQIKDEKILNLCCLIIASFKVNALGLPLGNLTSQWFANIYLHELDYCVKNILKIKKYLRYNDDIIILGTDKQKLSELSNKIKKFVACRLDLEIPESKCSMDGLPKAVDILGLCTDGYKVWLRKTMVRKAKEKMLDKMTVLAKNLLDSLCSYSKINSNINFEELNF